MRTILIIISIFIVFVSYSYIYFYIIAGTPSINVRKNVDVNKRIPIITNLIKKVSSVADCKLVLLYGTLLGQYRNNSIICYDYDADIGVFEEDYDKIVRNIIKEFGNNNKFKIHKSYIRGVLQIWDVETSVSIDIMCLKHKNGYVHRNIPFPFMRPFNLFLDECASYKPSSWFFPLKKVDFLECSNIYVPNKSAKLLKCFYGDNFEVPDHKCNDDCSVCTKII